MVVAGMEDGVPDWASGSQPARWRSAPQPHRLTTTDRAIMRDTMDRDISALDLMPFTGRYITARDIIVGDRTPIIEMTRARLVIGPLF
jgi:hypothetical protein